MIKITKTDSDYIKSNVMIAMIAGGISLLQMVTFEDYTFSAITAIVALAIVGIRDAIVATNLSQNMEE
jgi:hypothetical protein